VIKDGWVDWAERVDGVPDKIYSAPCKGLWLTCHSIVGEESEFQDGIPNRFLSTEKWFNPATNRIEYTPAAAASCKFILRKNGHLIQMYPLVAATWTSGGPEANVGSDAIEAEGGGPAWTTEPLTKAAEDTFIRLYTELEAARGWDPKRPLDYLRQHKDVARAFDYAPTACASDRYSNAWNRLAAGERYGENALKLTELQTENLLLRVFAGSEFATTETRQQRLERALRELDKAETTQSVNDKTESMVLGLRDHIQNHAAGVSGPTRQHDHIQSKVVDK